MPLIILTGTPAAGKSFRAKQLQEYFTNEKQKTVHVIDEDEFIEKNSLTKNDCFSDSQKEKVSPQKASYL